jgi:hypothetical protein
MPIPALLSDEEIRDIYEGGHAQEAIAIYGWDRIITTLVAYNVLRKRIQDPGEMDWKVYKSCPLCKRPGPTTQHPWNSPEAIAADAKSAALAAERAKGLVPGVVPGSWLEETIAEHRESPRIIMVCKHCGRDQATWARTGDGACSYCYGEKTPAPPKEP